MAAPHPVAVVDVSPFARGGSSSSSTTTTSGGGGGSSEAAKAEAAAAWDAALRACGTATIVGTGVSAAAVRELEREARAFFAAPEETKASVAAAYYGDTGYCAPGVESVSRTAVDNDAPQRPPDAVESFVYHGHAGRDKLPSEAALPGFASALGRYWGELEALTRALMSLSAAALGLEEDHFEAAYARHASVLRLAHYPPAAAAVSARGEGEAAAGRLRYGEHTDYIGFTILFQDDSPRPGLEVRMPGGEFVDVPPLPSTAADGADGGGGVSFTVNVADMIARWTNDRWPSPLHRVANGAPGAERGRLSVVFFSGPSNDTLVECLPGCGEPKYAPVVCGEYLRAKLEASNG